MTAPPTAFLSLPLAALSDPHCEDLRENLIVFGRGEGKVTIPEYSWSSVFFLTRSALKGDHQILGHWGPPEPADLHKRE